MQRYNFLSALRYPSNSLLRPEIAAVRVGVTLTMAPYARTVPQF